MLLLSWVGVDLTRITVIFIFMAWAVQRPRLLKRMLLLENHKLTRRFLAEGNNVSVVHVQYHFFRVWQMETCHGLGEVARRNWVLGTMPKQLQQHFGLRKRIFIYGPTPTYKQKQGAINECFQVICLNIQKKIQGKCRASSRRLRPYCFHFV